MREFYNVYSFGFTLPYFSSCLALFVKLHRASFYHSLGSEVPKFFLSQEVCTNRTFTPYRENPYNCGQNVNNYFQDYSL